MTWDQDGAHMCHRVTNSKSHGSASGSLSKMVLNFYPITEIANER